MKVPTLVRSLSRSYSTAAMEKEPQTKPEERVMQWRVYRSPRDDVCCASALISYCPLSAW